MTSGPTNAQIGGTGTTYIWWNVNFDSGTDGWVASIYLAEVSTTVDVQPLNVTRGSSSVAPGGSLSVSWQIKNNGTGTAASSNSQVRITTSNASNGYGNSTNNVGSAQATGSIGAGATVSQSTTVTVPTTPGTYYVWISADNNGALTQSNTTNDFGVSPSFTVTAPTTVDVEPINVTRGSSSVAPGGSLSVSWQIRNNGSGTAASSNSQVRITTSNASSGYGNSTNNVGSAQATGSIGAGASVSQSTTVTAPTTPGTYYVWISADNNGALTQSNTNNDFAVSSSFTVTAPTIVDVEPINVTRGSSSVVPGGSLSVSWQIRNNGTGTAASSNSQVRITTSNASTGYGNSTNNVGSAQATGSIASGAIVSQSTTVTVPTTPGTYYVWISADNSTSLVQSNTTNDFAVSASFTVAAATTVDVEPINVTRASSSVAPGGSLSVSWQIRNNGTGTAASSNSQVRITTSNSSNGYGNSTNNVGSAQATGSIGAGATISQSTTVTVPTTPGTYYVWISADNNTALVQSNTTNDFAVSASFTVTSQTTIPATPANPSPGSTSSPGPTTSGNSVTMSWNASSGATSYGIGVRDTVTNALVVDTTTTNTSYSANNLTAGRTYRWNVAAINASGTSNYTTPLYFTTPGSITKPSTPANPSPGSTTSPGPTMSGNSVTMSWNSVSGATSYGIGVRDMITNTLIVDTTTATMSYTVNGLTAGRTYRWNVAAMNSGGTSSYTTALYFTIPGGGTIPATPGDASPGSTSSPGPTQSSSTVTMNWSASAGATSYGIAVRDIQKDELVVDTTTTTTSYTATNLTAGTSYRWNVAAFNSSGNSSYSPTLYFQTPSTTGLAVTVAVPNGGEIWIKAIPQSIKWSVTGDTSTISNFFISYSVDGGNTYSNDIGGTVPSTSRSTSWTPPREIPSGALGRIRVQARNVSNAVVAQDTSNTNFNFASISTTGTRFDHTKFLDGYNANFVPPLLPEHRAALDALLSFIERDPALPLDGDSKHLRWAAYILATTWHETGKKIDGIFRRTFLPVEESWGDRGGYHPDSKEDYFNYWYSGVIGNGNYASGDGFRFRGRGYVQVTGRENYDKFGIVDNPDSALDPATSYNIMSKGMTVGPLFRSPENLEKYITATGLPDYLHSRRIIQSIDYPNNLTKQADQYKIAQDIADAAGTFEAILKACPSTSLSVATPAISPGGGTYIIASGQQLASVSSEARGTYTAASNAVTTIPSELVTVSLACVTDGATIYYTVDGSTPTTDSTVYLGPFTVSDSTTVHAIAVAAGYADSGVGSAKFAFIPAESVGAVSISISPGSAVNAGAEWQLDGGAWHNGGDTLTDVSADTHTLTFKPVNNWTAPDNQVVTVNAGQTTFGSGIYISNGIQTSSVQVTISPFEAVAAGAQWQVDGGVWQNSGVTLTGLSPTSHVISYKPVNGWATLSNRTLTLDASEPVALNVTYIPNVITESSKVGMQIEGNSSYLTFSYRELIGVGNLSYTVGVSDDLQTWDWTESQIEQLGAPVATGDGLTEEVTIRLALPINSLPNRKFFQLRITQ